MKITRFLAAASIAALLGLGAAAFAGQQYPDASDNSSIGSAVMKYVTPQGRAQQVSSLLSHTSTAVESGHVFLSQSGGNANNFYGGQVNTHASSVWVFLIDGTSIPANGTLGGCGDSVHASGCVAKWWQVAANSTISIDAAFGPIGLQNGAVLVCSSTGDFTLTLSATCLFSGDVQ